MRQSVKKTGFTPVDHFTLDRVLPQLPPASQLVLLRIYRQTVGWHKVSDHISLSQFRKFTGLGHNTIIKAIKELEDKALIKVKRIGTRTNEYRLAYSMPSEYEGEQMLYSEYLQTPHWSNVRDSALQTAGGMCAVCSSTKLLNVHHKHYETLWREQPQDVVVLCKHCHRKLHGK